MILTLTLWVRIFREREGKFKTWGRRQVRNLESCPSEHFLSWAGMASCVRVALVLRYDGH